ncbi:hypothetical protein FH063_003212 [Azospirillum argentinense]|uniref:Uncharacterized protein n=1 Tax=Azospirillum argentinense TaxID=2970906 RepID=A0A5B0KMH1_9PROT|nr:hypothetical protein FH063_003212 [Azospirillum argentinense]
MILKSGEKSKVEEIFAGKNKFPMKSSAPTIISVCVKNVCRQYF